MVIYGIDANVLTREKRTGTERYVFELLRHMMELPLEDERIVLYASEPLKDFETLPEGWSVKTLSWKFSFKGWTHGRLSLELLLNAPTVFFSPAHEVPLYPGRGSVVSTVHDVAFRKLADIYSDKGRKRQEWAIARALKHADHILTVSETTKQDLQDFYGYASEKMTPTPLAVRAEDFNVDASDIDRVREAYQLKRPYFVSIGRVEKKKNMLTLVEAFDQFKQKTNADHLLVLGGSFGFGGDEIRHRIERSEFEKDIRVLGYVPEQDLAPLIAGAHAYVFPSNYEGFGIPALEAMAAGTPLIASDIPALREVAGEAALFAAPKDAPAWADAMERIAEDEALRDRLRAKGQERLAHFDWKKTAEKTLEALRRVWKNSSKN